MLRLPLRNLARKVNTSALSNSSRSASSLVVAEHEDGKTLSPGTLAAITAAQKIGGEVSVLVVGKNIAEAATHASKVQNIKKVLTADHAAFEHVLAENMAPFLSNISKNYTHILTPSNNASKNFIPRTAALLDSSPLSDIVSVIDENTFTRPVYAGNAISTVKMTDSIKFILVRSTAFEKASISTSTSAPIEAVAAVENVKDSLVSKFVSANVAKSDRPDLSTARVVVSGGRGLKSGENFKLLEALADKLGGAVGASRAAVDAGYVPNEYQVGQTGKVVAPDLYIAVGISGAIQHLSGMKDSKTIVAINKDKDAPIFQVADYGLVEDLFKAVPEMTGKV